MASSQSDNNCINCAHRPKPETFKNCALCFGPEIPGNSFPGWEPSVKEAKPCC